MQYPLCRFDCVQVFCKQSLCNILQLGLIVCKSFANSRYAISYRQVRLCASLLRTVKCNSLQQIVIFHKQLVYKTVSMIVGFDCVQIFCKQSVCNILQLGLIVSKSFANSESVILCRQVRLCVSRKQLSANCDCSQTISVQKRRYGQSCSQV